MKKTVSEMGIPAGNPSYAEHPGILLQEEFLQPLQISQRQFAFHIGVAPMTVSELVRGKRAINLELALKIGRALNMTPDFWINAQNAYDYVVSMERLRRRGKMEKIEAITPIAALA